MKTTFKTKQEVKHDWYLVDASGKVLGEVATKVAAILRGKNKVYFATHVDCGDNVVVINVDKIRVTGNKMADKIYFSHSLKLGGKRIQTLSQLLAKQPTKALELAVRGMLPRNKLRSPIMSKLKLFVGEKHDHEAQKPVKIDL